MSCSVHDVVRLERLRHRRPRGGTEPFVDEALEQARVLGMPDYRMVFVPHPVQLLALDELHARRGRGCSSEIVARLVRQRVATDPRRFRASRQSATSRVSTVPLRAKREYVTERPDCRQQR